MQWSKGMKKELHPFPQKQMNLFRNQQLNEIFFEFAII
jgi:hypothetical protein